MILIDKNIDAIKSLCEQHNVEELYVFGSVLSRKFNEQSDLDFLVKFGQVELSDYFENYMNFKESLELLFDRDVDLIEVQTLKNPVLIESINRNKQLIYGRKDSEMVI